MYRKLVSALLSVCLFHNSSVTHLAGTVILKVGYPNSVADDLQMLRTIQGFEGF